MTGWLAEPAVEGGVDAAMMDSRQPLGFTDE
jgi:hypothetical protein